MPSCCLQESLPTAHLEVSLVAKVGVRASDATIHLAGTVSIETHSMFSESAFLPSVNRFELGHMSLEWMLLGHVLGNLIRPDRAKDAQQY